MIGSARSTTSRSKREKRVELRTQLPLKAKIFVPNTPSEEPCEIVDFSAGGAGIKTAACAPVGTRVVIYIDCFGRYEGVVVQRNRMRLGVRFLCSPSRKTRTTALIASFVANGMSGTLPFRRNLRVEELPPLEQFVRGDGAGIDCEVVDLALGGALLKTESRPDVGEIVHFGETAGRVARHTDEGIAIEFLAVVPPKFSGDRFQIRKPAASRAAR